VGEQHSVQINDSGVASQAPTPDSELREAVAQQEGQEQQEAPEQTDVVSERPEWLPEKFQSPEDLAKAYGELESKLSNDGQPDALSDFSKEYEEKGQLGDSSYDKLEKMGISREMVDLYISGLQASQDRESKAVYDIVGGSDQFEKMAAWVGSNLAESEVSTLNEMLSQGGEPAKMAAQLIKTRYDQVNGRDASLIKGNVASTSKSTFGSYHELMQAMNDPRYQSDPVYQKQVADRLAVSKELL
jgi:hypothetical protein